MIAMDIACGWIFFPVVFNYKINHNRRYAHQKEDRNPQNDGKRQIDTLYKI
jgi:hypothetical protein